MGSVFQKRINVLGKEKHVRKPLSFLVIGAAPDFCRGSLRAQGQSGWAPQALELGWAVSASSQESVPEVLSSQVENHKGHPHGYFKQHVCWQNTNVVTQIPRHRLQRHLTAFKIHFFCFAKLHWEIMLLNYTLIKDVCLKSGATV